jgi:hypothetical protein
MFLLDGAEVVRDTYVDGETLAAVGLTGDIMGFSVQSFAVLPQRGC